MPLLSRLLCDCICEYFWNPQNPNAAAAAAVALMEKWQHKVDSEFSIFSILLLRLSMSIRCLCTLEYNFRIISDVQRNRKHQIYVEMQMHARALCWNGGTFPKWRDKKNVKRSQRKQRKKWGNYGANANTWKLCSEAKLYQLIRTSVERITKRKREKKISRNRNRFGSGW